MLVFMFISDFPPDVISFADNKQDVLSNLNVMTCSIETHECCHAEKSNSMIGNVNLSNKLIVKQTNDQKNEKQTNIEESAQSIRIYILGCFVIIVSLNILLQINSLLQTPTSRKLLITVERDPTTRKLLESSQSNGSSDSSPTNGNTEIPSPTSPGDGNYLRPGKTSNMRTPLRNDRLLRDRERSSSLPRERGIGGG